MKLLNNVEHVHDNATVETMYLYKRKADCVDEMTRDLNDN